MINQPTLNLPQTPTKVNRNIYSVSHGEIFRRNFLAGLARTLGSIVIYLLFLTGLGILASQLLLPQLQNLIQNFTPLLNLGSNQSSTNFPQTNPQQINQLLNQFNN